MGLSLVTFLLFIVVMFIVNPLIDGQDGLSVIQLQLAFHKQDAITIVQGWNEGGIKRFEKYIVSDYMYAFSYTLFFLSVLKFLEQKGAFLSKYLFVLPVIAGVFDMIENSLEIFFLRDMENFSNSLFLFHSLIATIKWMILPVVFFYIMRFFIIEFINKNRYYG